MSKRTAMGENPLDLIVPKEGPETGPASEDEAEKTDPATRAEEAGAKKRPAPTKKTQPPAPEAVEQRREAPTPAAKAPAETAAAVEGRAERQRAPAGQYLTFDLGNEEYGAGILQIKEIINYTPTTPVPQTPPWIRGVINLRGSVVPIVDLSKKFGLGESKVSDRTCIVLVDVTLEADRESTVLGVLADSVKQVVDLSDEEIEPPPNFGTRIHIDYMLGMGRVDERFIPLLDIDRVLTLSELTEVSAVQEAEVEGEVSEVAGEPVEPKDAKPDAKRPETSEPTPST